jgi:hypothetical protein
MDANTKAIHDAVMKSQLNTLSDFYERRPFQYQRHRPVSPQAEAHARRMWSIRAAYKDIVIREQPCGIPCAENNWLRD